MPDITEVKKSSSFSETSSIKSKRSESFSIDDHTWHGKTWKDFFQEYSVSQIRQLNVRFNHELSTKKVQFKSLVGTKYSDLLLIADEIVDMEALVEKEQDYLKKISSLATYDHVQKTVNNFNKFTNNINLVKRSNKEYAAQILLFQYCLLTKSRIQRKYFRLHEIYKATLNSPLSLIAKLLVLAEKILVLIPDSLNNGKREMQNKLDDSNDSFVKVLENLLLKFNNQSNIQQYKSNLLDILLSFAIIKRLTINQMIDTHLLIFFNYLKALSQKDSIQKQELLDSMYTINSALFETKNVFPNKFSKQLLNCQSLVLSTDSQIINCAELNFSNLSHWLPESILKATLIDSSSNISIPTIESVSNLIHKYAFKAEDLLYTLYDNYISKNCKSINDLMALRKDFVYTLRDCYMLRNINDTSQNSLQEKFNNIWLSRIKNLIIERFEYFEKSMQNILQPNTLLEDSKSDKSASFYKSLLPWDLADFQIETVEDVQDFILNVENFSSGRIDVKESTFSDLYFKWSKEVSIDKEGLEALVKLQTSINSSILGDEDDNLLSWLKNQIESANNDYHTLKNCIETNFHNIHNKLFTILSEKIDQEEKNLIDAKLSMKLEIMSRNMAYFIRVLFWTRSQVYKYGDSGVAEKAQKLLERIYKIISKWTSKAAIMDYSVSLDKIIEEIKGIKSLEVLKVESADATVFEKDKVKQVGVAGKNEINEEEEEEKKEKTTGNENENDKEKEVLDEKKEKTIGNENENDKENDKEKAVLDEKNNEVQLDKKVVLFTVYEQPLSWTGSPAVPRDISLLLTKVLFKYNEQLSKLGFDIIVSELYEYIKKDFYTVFEEVIKAYFKKFDQIIESSELKFDISNHILQIYFDIAALQDMICLKNAIIKDGNLIPEKIISQVSLLSSEDVKKRLNKNVQDATTRSRLLFPLMSQLSG